jgi:hypothetical protein
MFTSTYLGAMSLLPNEMCPKNYALLSIVIDTLNIKVALSILKLRHRKCTVAVALQTGHK